MDAVAAEQTALLCPSCAGQCVYDPSHQGLTCQSCGTARKIVEPDGTDPDAEERFDPSAPDPDPIEAEKVRTHHCETCGGDVVFTGPALSDRCPYCDGPVVLSTQDIGYQTMAVIPCRVPETDAQKAALNWVKRRIAAPNDLPSIVATGRVAGLYAPFWTFDSEEAVEYWAKYTTGSGKHRRTRKTQGKMKIRFDDLLAPASPHITPLIRDGILHEFLPERLRSYQAAYLAGFAAERHHQSVTEGLSRNKADKRLLMKNRIKHHINKRGVHDIRFKTDTSGIRYRRILLPVWILHYRYNGTPMKVVVSGINGRTYGERPFSRWKLFGYSVAVSAAVMAIGLFWGATGLL